MKLKYFDDPSLDGEILIATANRASGVWANEIRVKNQRVVRNAGRLKTTSATAHTLLAIALISGLRSKLVNRIVPGGNKFRLSIKTTDLTFTGALQDAIAGQPDPDRPFRVVRSLQPEVLKSCSRFDLKFSVERQNHGIYSLGNWASANIIDLGRLESDEAVASVYLPQTVSELGGMRFNR